MLIKNTIVAVVLLLIIGCNANLKPVPHLLQEPRSQACQKEIEKTISALIHAKHLTLSQDIFSKTSFLHVTNKQNSLLTQSPLINDFRGRKGFKLYKKGDELYIGLLDENKEVINATKLNKCD